jgi:hypothetical protein
MIRNVMGSWYKGSETETKTLIDYAIYPTTSQEEDPDEEMEVLDEDHASPNKAKGRRNTEEMRQRSHNIFI